MLGNLQHGTIASVKWALSPTSRHADGYCYDQGKFVEENKRSNTEMEGDAGGIDRL